MPTRVVVDRFTPWVNDTTTGTITSVATMPPTTPMVPAPRRCNRDRWRRPGIPRKDTRTHIDVVESHRLRREADDHEDDGGDGRRDACDRPCRYVTTQPTG